jgi:uncharacterized membrane protein
VWAPDRSRSRLAPLLIGLLASAGALAGCHKAAADKAKVADIKQSLDGLRKRLDDLTTKFADLRKQIDGLPPDLPGYSETRAKFYGTEEGRGVTDLKLTLMAGRLDAASTSGKSADLDQLSQDVAKTYGELNEFDQLYVTLLHQVMTLQRMEARQKAEAAAAATADASPTPPAAKAKRPKSKP